MTVSWLVLTASERGASHIAMNAPNQDSVASAPVGPASVAAAVADGHGHWRHLRSARGSEFAVEVGCQVGRLIADRMKKPDHLHSQREAPPTGANTAGEVEELVREVGIPAIIDKWRDNVLADLAARPFSDEEQDQRLPGDDPTVAYGSTLLLAVALRDWLILAQIGDGDIIGVRADGSAVVPVPFDLQLDGLMTTSLCGADPNSDFRVAVIDLADDPLVAVLLATDGYGNAQLVEDWPNAFSKDLASLLASHDENWLADQLPGWTAKCASAEGSADDTTVALLISPACRKPQQGSEEITMPVPVVGDTAVQDDPDRTAAT